MRGACVRLVVVVPVFGSGGISFCPGGRFGVIASGIECEGMRGLRMPPSSWVVSAPLDGPRWAYLNARSERSRP